MGLYEQTEQPNKEAKYIHVDFTNTEIEVDIYNATGHQILAAIMVLVDKVIKVDERVTVELASMIEARAIIGRNQDDS